jgi:hypothetical protein
MVAFGAKSANPGSLKGRAEYAPTIFPMEFHGWSWLDLCNSSIEEEVEA